MVKPTDAGKSQEEVNRLREEARNRNQERERSNSRKKREASEQREKNKQRAAMASKRRAEKSFWDQYWMYICIAGVATAVLVMLQFSGPNSSVQIPAEIPAIDDQLIAQHNEGDSDYSLGGNKLFDGVSIKTARNLFNNKISDKTTLPKCPPSKDTSALPDSYNFRFKFPSCEKPIVEQGLCSSSWAVVAAGVFTDRYCALTGDHSYKASAQQLLTCDKKVSSACEKGFLISAFEYGRNKGFVSEDCMKYNPYDITVDCNYSELNKCHQKEKVSDYCVVEGVENIKREILTNGPVASVFPAYRDFVIYRDGVYQPAPDATKIEGDHALKIIGWDTDGRNKHWIVENSFGEEWGQNGIAKIKMDISDSQLSKAAVAVFVKQEEAQTE